MCENLNGKFVVPIKPLAGRGWCIGQIIGIRNAFYEVNILWVQYPEYADGNIIGMHNMCVEEFDTAQEAIDCLRLKGASDFVASPAEIGF